MAQKTKSQGSVRSSLRSVRDHLGVSQEELARDSGVSRSVIANFESGRTSEITREDVLNLARVLNLKEQARVASHGETKRLAAEFLLGVLWMQKRFVLEERLGDLEAKMKILAQQRKDLKRRLAAIEAEEMEVREHLSKPSGKPI